LFTAIDPNFGAGSANPGIKIASNLFSWKNAKTYRPTFN
jgi:hypothetical protein